MHPVRLSTLHHRVMRFAPFRAKLRQAADTANVTLSPNHLAATERRLSDFSCRQRLARRIGSRRNSSAGDHEGFAAHALRFRRRYAQSFRRFDHLSGATDDRRVERRRIGLRRAWQP